MSYYKVLGLAREPFSSSPDPEFFFHSVNHETALKRLEIAIRLRRGLSLVLGDVGTGKTTLSRTLLQVFADDENFIFHMILDPGFRSEFQFLMSLVKMFGVTPSLRSTIDLKDELKKYLFQKGVADHKTIVLLIDEGQKITAENLEVLRTLLNFETNEYKLLQLVIMAQVELLPRLVRIPNFMDRVVFKYTLNTLDEAETRHMIDFRLKQAGCSARDSLFTDEAVRLIHQHTQGYPRKIALLCHDALEAIVMKDYSVVDAKVVRSVLSNRHAEEGYELARREVAQAY